MYIVFASLFKFFLYKEFSLIYFIIWSPNFLYIFSINYFSIKIKHLSYCHEYINYKTLASLV